MLDIVNEDGTFKLVWRYAIKNNKARKTRKNGETVEYIYHTTTLPGEIVRYFHHPKHVYMYTWEGEYIITDTEPLHAEYVKVVLMYKGRQDARSITLSKKVFDLHGYTSMEVKYTFHADREDITGKRGIITIEIVQRE